MIRKKKGVDPSLGGTVNDRQDFARRKIRENSLRSRFSRVFEFEGVKFVDGKIDGKNFFEDFCSPDFCLLKNLRF